MVPYHEEISGKAWSMWQHHIPLYKALSNYNFTLTLLTAGFFNFDRSWNLSIHKFIIELHVLQCLFVRGSNKKQRRGRIISSLTHINQVIILQCGPPSFTLPKNVSLQEENVSGNSIERRVYILIYFENWQGAPCSHRQSRNRMMNTFTIVNIAPICR